MWGLGLLFLVAVMWRGATSKPIPHGETGPAAEAMADAILKAVNVETLKLIVRFK